MQIGEGEVTQQKPTMQEKQYDGTYVSYGFDEAEQPQPKSKQTLRSLF